MSHNQKDTQKFVYKRRKFSFFRSAEWFATILLFLILALVIAGFFPISHPWLTERLSNKLKTIGADSCSIENISVTLWRGIELSDLELSMTINNREHYSFSAAKTVLSVNIVSAILNSQKFLDGPFNLHNDHFQDLFNNINGKLKEMIQFLKMYQGFKSLAIEKMTVEIQRPDSLVTTIQQGSLDIFQNKEKNALDIKYQFGNFLHGSTVLDNGSGTLSIDEYTVKILKSRGKVLSGKYRATGEIDLLTSQLQNGQVSISELDLSSLIHGADSITGKISGIIEGEIRFETSQLNRDSLQGTGNITVRNLDIAGARVQSSICELLAVPQLDTLHFEKVKSDFTLKKNLTIFNETHGIGKLFNFKSKGWIQRDGALHQDIKGDITTELVKDLPQIVAKSMDPGTNGERVFRCRVYGNLASPRVELDSLILKRAIGNVFEDVRANLKNLFMKKLSVE